MLDWSMQDRCQSDHFELPLSIRSCLPMPKHMAFEFDLLHVYHCFGNESRAFSDVQSTYACRVGITSIWRLHIETRAWSKFWRQVGVTCIFWICCIFERRSIYFWLQTTIRDQHIRLGEYEVWFPLTEFNHDLFTSSKNHHSPPCHCRVTYGRFSTWNSAICNTSRSCWRLDEDDVNGLSA